MSLKPWTPRHSGSKSPPIDVKRILAAYLSLVTHFLLEGRGAPGFGDMGAALKPFITTQCPNYDDTALVETQQSFSLIM